MDLSRPSRAAHAVRTVLGAALVLLVAATGVIASAGPAAAHTVLVSSSPKDGTTSDVAPAVVVLTFNETPKVDSIRAERTDGTPVTLPAPVQRKNVVTVAWPVTAPPGVYRLGYQVTSDDGDPVLGTILFGYDAPRPVTASTASASSTPTVAPTPSSTPTAPAPSASGGAAAPAADPPASGSATPWILAAAVLALGVGGWLLLRRARPDAVDDVPPDAAD